MKKIYVRIFKLVPGDLSGWAVTVMIHLLELLTLFFSWDRSNLFGIQNHHVYFGLAMRFWSRIGRTERRCTPFDSLLWNQFVHIFRCINLLYHQKQYKSMVMASLSSVR